MPMIVETMAEAGVAWDDLSLIGVTVGPGTFTGIRIGLAAARGMALAGPIALAGVGTLEAIAFGVPAASRRGRTVLAAVDSKREDLFFQAFDESLTPLSEPFSASPSAIPGRFAGPLLVAGDAAPLVLPSLSDAVAAAEPCFPDARVVAELALLRHQQGRALAAVPLYLRAPDVTLPCRPEGGAR